MIEKKLEDVIEEVEYIDDKWLQYSRSNILNKDWQDIDALWESICLLACDDEVNPYLADISVIFDTFPKEVYGKIMSKEYLEELLKELKPIVLYSAYYFGADYIYRNSGKIDVFNVAYIKRILGDIIPQEIASNEDDFATIYDRIRKTVPSYTSHLREYYAPEYINPYAVKMQKEQHYSATGREKFDLFLGNIILFFFKIYNINDTALKYGKHTVGNSIKWNRLNNVLLTITLILFETIPSLPAHKNTDHGNWTCERIMEIENKIKLYKGQGKLGIESSIGKIITEYAIEDLFHLERISYALEQYYTFIDKIYDSGLSINEVYDKNSDRTLLTICSLLVFLPSVGISKLCLQDINSLLKAYIFQSEKNMTTVMGPLLRIFAITGVIFPSIVAIFNRAWYTVLSTEHVKDRISLLEKYISVSKYTNILSDNKKIWESDKFLTRKRKKNLRGKLNEYKVLSPQYTQYFSFETSMKILLDQIAWWNLRTIIDRNKRVLPKEMANLHEITDEGLKRIVLPTSKIDIKGTLLGLVGGIMKELGYF